MKVLQPLRFWSDVCWCGASPADCWDWGGYRLPNGYGYVRFGGVSTGAHRHAYMLATGESIVGMVVRHTCDNPACCNPAHLLRGTQADNIADKLARGRHRRGERCPWARLTESDVRYIRDASASGETHEVIASRLGVSREHVGKIVRGQRWTQCA